MNEGGFDLKTLTGKQKQKLVEGRVLEDKARTAIANIKYALKFFDEYSDSTKDNPSGRKLEDMLLYVRQKMYEQLRGKIHMKGVNKALKQMPKTCPHPIFLLDTWLL